MVEFLLFPLAVGGTFAVRSLLGKSNSDKSKIQNLFKDLGIGAEKGKGKNRYVVYPKLCKEFPQKWGTSYSFRLPSGFPVPAKHVVKKFPLDLLLSDMLQTDVLTTEKDGLIIVEVYHTRLTEYVEYNDDWLKKCKNYNVVLGVDGKGLVMHSFRNVPHMVIGGMTRYGKTVLMKLLITQLAITHQSVKFHLIDMKGGLAFNRFKNLPQVHSVSSTIKECHDNLKLLRKKIDERMKWFAKMGFEDIGEAEKAGYLLGRDLIIIDELSVLAPLDKKEEAYQMKITIWQHINYIAQVTAGLGYNLIVCSQYPTGDILPRQVKQNSDAKIALRLPTNQGSRVILDEDGAEDLEYGLKGRAILRTDKKQFIQIPIIYNDKIDEWLEPLKVVRVENATDTETGNDTDEIRDVRLCI